MSGRRSAGKNTLAKAAYEYFSDKGISVQECSFADTLKQFCINTLGLTHNQCYGSDEDKNSETEYLWENVEDDFLRWKFAGCKWKEKGIENGLEMDRDTFHYCSSYRSILKEGKITAREVMQLLGTDLIRKTFGNVWAAATIRSILSSPFDISIITDNRFPNEAESVLSQPLGFVVKLTRAPIPDAHASESSMDGFNWQRDKCFVLDNRDMSLEQQEEHFIPILDQILVAKKEADVAFQTHA